MKVRLSRQRCACLKCGRCCLRHNVLVFPEERAHLEGLEVPGVSRPYSERVGGREVLRLHSDPAEGCVFLAEDRTCRIHRSHGFAAKLLSCRAYPLSVFPTFEGEVGVMACFDCPGVMAQAGEPLERQRAWIDDVVSSLGSSGRGFTPGQRCRLLPEAILDIVQALRRVLRTPAVDFRTALRACQRLVSKVSVLDAGMLNQAGVRREVLDGLVGRGSLFQTRRRTPDPPGGLLRMQFRSWLGAICRREGESAARGAGFRLRRMLGLARFVCGRGSWHALADGLPDIPFQEAGLFPAGGAPPWDAAAWESCRRYLQARLESLLFFGAAYYGVDFWQGLWALLESVLAIGAIARCHAAARGATGTVGAADVEKGVAAVDYCFGRSPALAARLHRGTERLFSGEAFAGLLLGL